MMQNKRRYWLPDSSSKSCTNCDLPFTLFRRRHHCRICGKIFCHACSSSNISTPDGDVRVCDDCRLFAPSLLAPGSEQGNIMTTPSDPTMGFQPTTPVGVHAVDLGVAPSSQPLAQLDFSSCPPSVPKEFDIVNGSGGGLGVFDDRKGLGKPPASLFNSPFNAEADAVFRRLCSAADAHLNWAVQQAVLQTFSRSPALQDIQQQTARLQNWTSAILKLTRRCVSVDPNVRAGDRMDVRVYVKVKAIPLPSLAMASSSTTSECRVGTCDIINGAMFQRSLPHKGMRHDIENPRIMLLNDSISYEGRSNAKLLSLETLGEQERRYLEILVNKVLSLRPDLLFVSGTVSSAALEMLLGGKVAVVPGVKLAQLHRLSRFTGARILPSVNLLDKLVESQVIGTASHFFIRTLQVPTSWFRLTSPVLIQVPLAGQRQVCSPSAVSDASPVSFVVVEGVPSHLGATVIIRGHADDVVMVKSILRYAIYMARSLRLETAFLFDGLLERPPLTAACGSCLENINGQLPAWASAALLHVPAFVVSGAYRWLLSIPSSPGLDLLDIVRYHSGEEGFIHSDSAAEMPFNHREAASSHDSLAGEQEGLIVSVCISHDSAQCKQPIQSYVRYYSLADTSIGQFLENSCFAENDFCKTCRASAPAHKQTYLHHRGRLDITVKQLTEKSAAESMQQNYAAAAKRSAADCVIQQRGINMPYAKSSEGAQAMAPAVEENMLFTDSFPSTPSTLRTTTIPASAIPISRAQSVPAPAVFVVPHVRASSALQTDFITWAFCTQCKAQVASPTRMSRGALTLSFYKYLELVFYNHSFVTTYCNCKHTPALHYTRYFARGRNVAFFRYTPIAPHYVNTVPSLLLDQAWSRSIMARHIQRMVLGSSSKTALLTTSIRDLNSLVDAAEGVFVGLVQANMSNDASGRSSPVAAAVSSSPVTIAVTKKGGSTNDVLVALAPYSDSYADSSGGMELTVLSSILDDSVASQSRELFPPPRLELIARASSDEIGNAVEGLDASMLTPFGGGGGSATPVTTRSTSVTTRPSKKVLTIEQQSLPRLIATCEKSMSVLRRLKAELVVLQSSVLDARTRLVDHLVQESTPESVATSLMLCSDALEVMFHGRDWTVTMQPIEERVAALPGLMQRHASAVIHAAVIVASSDRGGFSVAGVPRVASLHDVTLNVTGLPGEDLHAAIGVVPEPISSLLHSTSDINLFEEESNSVVPLSSVNNSLRYLKSFVAAALADAATPTSQGRSVAAAAMVTAGKSFRALLPGGFAAAVGTADGLFAGPEGSAALYLQPGLQCTAVLVDPRVVSTVIAHSLCSANYWSELAKYAAAEAQGLLGHPPDSNGVADNAVSSLQVCPSGISGGESATEEMMAESGGFLDDLEEVEDEDDEEENDDAEGVVRTPSTALTLLIPAHQLDIEMGAMSKGRKARSAARSFTRVSFAAPPIFRATSSSSGRSSIVSPVSALRSTPSFRQATWQQVDVASRSPSESLPSSGRLPAPQVDHDALILGPVAAVPRGFVNPIPTAAASIRSQTHDAIASSVPRWILGSIRGRRHTVGSGSSTTLELLPTCTPPSSTSANPMSPTAQRQPQPMHDSHSLIISHDDARSSVVDGGPNRGRKEHARSLIDPVQWAFHAGDLIALSSSLPPPTLRAKSLLSQSPPWQVVSSGELSLASTFPLPLRQTAAESMWGATNISTTQPLLVHPASAVPSKVLLETEALAVSTSALSCDETPLALPQSNATVGSNISIDENAASKTAAEANTQREARNFGTTLPLSAAEMLVSRARVDIVHRFSDREATSAPQPSAAASTASEATTSFVVTSYWSLHFHALRELCLESNRAFVLSLAFAEGWNASGGKSGAQFERSLDHRFLVKHVSKTEFYQFVDVIAAPYFEHMRASIVDKQLTLLVPILGAFRVVTHVRSPGNAGTKRIVCFAIVQADLFRGRTIAPGLKFDLKGKSRAQKKSSGVAAAAAAAQALAPAAAAPISDADHLNRSVDTTDASPVSPAEQKSGSSVVLLDDDFLALNRGLPFPLTDDAKTAFAVAVRRDTEFLRNIGVVDYSLLVGIDNHSGEVVVGVIDYLRLFDTIKRLESLGKRILEADPTVIAPGPYMDRLNKALDRYFVAVPNKWSGLPTEASAPVLPPEVSVAASASAAMVANAATGKIV